jgi:glycosyltransferase involved in cell wall biosynthesis
MDLESFASFLEAEQSVSFCFVDDGSDDGTAELLAGLAHRFPARAFVVRHEANRGKAEAIRTGMQRMLAEDPEFAGYVDADLSAPLEEIRRLTQELRDHPDVTVAIGSRVRLLGRSIVRSPLRHLLGRAFATAASIALRLPVYDTQCGLKLFRATPAVGAAFAAPFLTRWLFDVELLARMTMTVSPPVAMREVPLEVWHARGGSRLRWRDFLIAPVELWRIRRHYGKRP